MKKLGIKVSGLVVYGTATGIKIGSKGQVEHPGDVFSRLSKGEARRLRKALSREGFVSFASCRRIAA